ncbi:hypothetical protein HanRHA438_Chr13g0607751 [Helianthus annuus]|nr:hypothetical protein HanIR_Chr13g0649561 [Helianthus annuus]KAJ0859024.1 hypothetical protein HanRHA438_Chr13g0607751 [Helianthus annuus]
MSKYVKVGTIKKPEPASEPSTNDQPSEPFATEPAEPSAAEPAEPSATKSAQPSAAEPDPFFFGHFMLLLKPNNGHM